jgi:hypothetical protein
LGLSVGESSLGVDDANEVLEAPTLGSEDAAAKAGHPIISAALVAFSGGTAEGLFDQVGIDQPLESSVEGGGPEADFAARSLEDFLHDGVAVLVLVREGKENVEPVGLQGEKVFGCWHIYRLIHISDESRCQWGGLRKGRKLNWLAI